MPNDAATGAAGLRDSRDPRAILESDDDAVVRAKLLTAVRDNDRDTIACGYPIARKREALSDLRPLIQPLYEKITGVGRPLPPVDSITKGVRATWAAIAAIRPRDIELLTPTQVRDRPPQLELVRDIFPHRGIAALIGPPGCGKSFLAFDLSVAVALALGEWFGKRSAAGGSIYIGTEGMMGSRIRAREQHHEQSLDAAPLRIIEQGVDLLHPDADIREVLRRIDDAKADIGRIALTVIDTVNRTAPGMKENAPEDWGLYLSHVGRIVDATDGLVILIHHTGKNEAAGGRGHSSLLGALDCEIMVTADSSGNRSFTTSKQRDGADGIGFGFRLEIVDLGPHPHPQADADERLTSCVVVPCVATQQRKEPALTGVAKVALMALQEAVTDYGELMPGTTTIPAGAHATTMERWRTQFGLRYGAENKDATRKAFQRGREALFKASVVGISDPYAWVWK